MTHFWRTDWRYVCDCKRKNAKRNPTTCSQNDRGHQIRTLKKSRKFAFYKKYAIIMKIYSQYGFAQHSRTPS